MRCCSDAERLLLCSKYNFFNACNLPISAGREVSLLLRKSSHFNACKFPISAGRMVRLLLRKYNSFNPSIVRQSFFTSSQILPTCFIAYSSQPSRHDSICIAILRIAASTDVRSVHQFFNCSFMLSCFYKYTKHILY